MARLVYEITGNVAGLGNALKQASSGLKSLENDAARANASIKQDITSIGELKRAINDLNRQKIQITDPAQLVRQNRLIEELQAELTRTERAGKTGFDSLGNAIAQSATKTQGFSSSLQTGYGFIRQLAYILPGIGIAGIFNVAFTAISAAADQLGIFNTKLTQTQQNQANANAINKSAAKNYGDEIVALRELYAAATDVKNSQEARVLSGQKLQESFPGLFGSLKTEAILNGEAKNAYDAATQSIISNAKAKAAADQISSIAAKQFEVEAQKQKIIAADAINRDKNTANVRKALIENVGLSGDALEKRLAEITKPFNETLQVNQRNQLRSLDEQNRKYEGQIKFIEGVISGSKQIAAINTDQPLGLQQKLEAQIASLEIRRKASNDENEIGKLNIEIKQKQLELDELLGRNAKTKVAQAGQELSLRQQLDALINKANQRAGESGLEGYGLEVKKILDYYQGLNRELRNFDSNVRQQVSAKRISPTQGAQLLSKSADVRGQLVTPFNKELADAGLKETKRVADEITRINNEFGVKAAESKAKELAAIQARYDAEVVKAKGNAEILAAIDNGRIAAVQQVNDKYAAIQADLENKIIGIQEQAFATLTGKEEEQTERIRKEWESRRAALNGYYADLIKLTQVGGLLGVGTPTGLNFAGIASGLLKQGQAGANSNIDSAQSKAITNFINKDLYGALKNTSQGFVSNLRDGLFNANQDANRTFASVFSNLTSSFSKTIENGVFAVLQSKLEKALQDGIDKGVSGLGPKMQGIIAGLAVAGGLISGVTNKTSVVGQGIGGALSGAAAGIGGAVAIGAATGTALGPAGTIAGAAIGGLVGLVGGILGANKAQKELAEQQLKEQQQQTDLLKATLAYTTSVIGRMSADGIVTGFDIGATGEIIAKTQVSGQNLELILTRVRRQR